MAATRTASEQVIGGLTDERRANGSPKGATAWIDEGDLVKARKTVESISTSTIILPLLYGEQGWDVSELTQFTTRCATAVGLLADGNGGAAKIYLNDIASDLSA